MAWLTGWGYRKSHVINYASGAGTLYQKQITVHYGAGTDGDDDVYCNSHCRTDFGDIRFTDDDQVTLLDYWMEKKVDGSYAVFWVEVIDDLSSVARTIYVYYDKADATSISNGVNTFLLFDDFSTDTLASYTKNGTVTYDATNKWVSIGVDNDPTIHHRMTKGSFANVAVRGKLYLVGTYKGGYSQGAVLGRHGAGVAGYEGALIDGSSIGQQQRMTRDEATELGSASFAITRSVWYRMEFAFVGSALKQKAWLETGTEPSAYLISVTNTAYTSGSVGFFTYDKQFYVDELMVRKFVFPEPTHGAWGSEEQPIVVPTVTTQDATNIERY